MAGVFERIDSQFQKMESAELIRSDDFGSLIGIERNRVVSALEMLAATGVLCRIEMVDCLHCSMAVAKADFDEVLEDDGEYRCTSCDQRLTGRSSQVITAYRNGVKWRASIPAREQPQPPTQAGELTDGLYSASELAQRYGLGQDALRKKLERYRERHLDCCVENSDRRLRAPRYLYKLKDVKGVIDEMLASGERPAK